MKHLITVFSLTLLLVISGCASTGSVKSGQAKESRMQDPFAISFMEAFTAQICSDKDLYRECFKTECDPHATQVIHDCTEAADKEGKLPLMADIDAGKVSNEELRGVGEGIGYCVGTNLAQKRVNELIAGGADEAAVNAWADKCTAVFGQ